MAGSSKLPLDTMFVAANTDALFNAGAITPAIRIVIVRIVVVLVIGDTRHDVVVKCNQM